MFRLSLFLPLCMVLASLAGCPGQPLSPQPADPAPRRQTAAAPVQAESYTYAPPPALIPVPAAPAWQPTAGRVVILDPGHGGDNLGARYFGLVEKDINLDLALRTANRLRAMGITVLLTRRDDVFIPLPERSAFANKNPNAVFVSIHCNASDKNPQASGIETFVLSKQFSDDEQCRKALARYNVTGKNKEQSRQELANLTRVCRAEGPALAASLQRSMVTRLGDVDRGVKPGNLAVLRETYFCPAVLVETGFMSNYRTAAKMATPTWREMASQALADGIAAYLRGGA